MIANALKYYDKQFILLIQIVFPIFFTYNNIYKNQHNTFEK